MTKQQRRSTMVFTAAALVALLGGPTVNSARATILTFSMDTEFSGGTAPVGSAPWLQMKIDDHNGTGSVDLIIVATNLTGIENLSEASLNLAPALDPTDLVFSAPTKSRAFSSPTISTGVDAFQADGDGLYDIDLAFATGSGSNTFQNGDSIQYTISGIASLSAASFQYYSAPHGGHGPFTSAAHIQNTGVGKSGWVTDSSSGSLIVPEPASAVLLVVGLSGLCLVARRRQSIS